jgi:hypothetical protein
MCVRVVRPHHRRPRALVAPALSLSASVRVRSSRRWSSVPTMRGEPRPEFTLDILRMRPLTALAIEVVASRFMTSIRFA